MEINSKSVLILIPAFNEARTIGGVVTDIKRAGWRQVLVIDDGSQDLTAKKALKAGAKVLSHKRNRGKGAALKTGFAAARQLKIPYLVTLDGDGQHFSSDIYKLVKKLDAGSDVALGYRNYRLKTMPWTKILGNHLANLVTWLRYGLWVKDSQSGLRGYSQAALDKIRLKFSRYEVESELIGQIKTHQLSWVEVPIRISYGLHDQTKTDRVNLGVGLQTMWNLFFK